MTRFRLTRLTVTLLSVAAALAWSSAPALAGGSDWKVGYYTPSSHGALSFAAADRPDVGVAALNFTDQANTALLVTTHGSSKGDLLGDLRGKTIHAEFDITGVTGQGDLLGQSALRAAWRRPDQPWCDLARDSKSDPRSPKPITA